MCAHAPRVTQYTLADVGVINDTLLMILCWLYWLAPLEADSSLLFFNFTHRNILYLIIIIFICTTTLGDCTVVVVLVLSAPLEIGNTVLHYRSILR
jgi:hypothetical protein